MDKIIFLGLILFIALFFYMGIPVIGAVLARENWKKFRLRLMEFSRLPVLDYQHLLKENGTQGRYRFFGTIEAIQGQDRIWITNGHFTLAADLAGVSIYLLPTIAGFTRGMTNDSYLASNQDYEPAVLKWKQVYSLAEGTKVFLCGTLIKREGRSLFMSTRETPLTVVIYDGEETTILNRAILSGRKKNEYWNQFTLISLICGMISLLFIAYSLLRSMETRSLAIIAISLGVLPLSIFLPPGLALLYYYRKSWNRARNFRAARDMLLLPLEQIRNTTPLISDEAKTVVRLSDGSLYVMHKAPFEENRRLIRDPRKLIIRKCFYSEKALRESRTTHLFGRYQEEGEAYIIDKPADPMAELVLFPDNPGTIIGNCQRQSSRLIFLSVIFLALDIVINFFVILFILQLFI